MHRVTIIAAATLCAAAKADQIEFTHQGAGAGDIDGVPFSLTNFTIHATADTANIQDLGFGFSLDHDTATIDIQGVGTFEFLVPTRHFVNNTGQLVGFSRGGPGGTDLFDGPSNAAFGAWDMTTSIGPHSGSGELLQWDKGDILTDGGVLNMVENFDTFASFTAEVGAACRADCNADGNLDILDFVCYQGLFQEQDPAADCNADGDFNILDFVCFQGEFQKGCN